MPRRIWARSRSSGSVSLQPPPRPGDPTSLLPCSYAPLILLTHLGPAASDCPRGARRGCARLARRCGQGSGLLGRCRSSRWKSSGCCRRRRRRLQQQVSIKVLVRSSFPHSRRVQRRLQLFQNTRPVPSTTPLPPPPQDRPERSIESRRKAG